MQSRHRGASPIAGSIAALIAVTALVIMGAVTLLRSEQSDEPGNAERTNTATSRSTDQGSAEQGLVHAGRPACPAASVGAVELPCLGADQTAELTPADQVTVVSVWTWWCPPCREELPALAEFAAQHPEYSVVGVHAAKEADNAIALLTELDVDLPSYQDSENTFGATLGLPPVVPVVVVFTGDDMVANYPRPFTSAQDIERAVQEALA